MKRKQWAVYVLALILLMSLMTGCGGSSDTEDNDAAKPQEQEKEMDQEMGDLLSSQFVDLMSGDEYLMKYRTSMNMEGQTFDVEATVAVSGENTAITSITNGMESTNIIKGDKSYVIDHENKMVMVLSDVPDPEDSSFDGATGMVDVDSDISYLGNGKEGNLTYEEYASMDGTIRYYFDGDDLVKMVIESSGQTITMEILEISNTVPDGIFDIPGDYQMITM